MSDNWIRLIPYDPHFVPDKTLISVALERFWEIAPDSDEIQCEVSKEVRFFDCGCNFESVLCPSCKCEIAMEWWESRMEEDQFKTGFKLEKYPTPCCGESVTLNDLRYHYAQGFGKFLLDAMNPNIGELNANYSDEFERILGTRLRVIYQHI